MTKQEAFNIFTSQGFFLFKTIDADIVIKITTENTSAETLTFSVIFTVDGVEFEKRGCSLYSDADVSDFTAGYVVSGSEVVFTYYALTYQGSFMADFPSTGKGLKSYTPINRLGADGSFAVSIFTDEEFSSFSDKQKSVNITFLSVSETLSVIINGYEHSNCAIVIDGDASQGLIKSGGVTILQYKYLIYDGTFTATFNGVEQEFTSNFSINKEDAIGIFCSVSVDKYICSDKKNITNWLKFTLNDDSTIDLDISSLNNQGEYDTVRHKNVDVEPKSGVNYSEGYIVDENRAEIINYYGLSYDGEFDCRVEDNRILHFRPISSNTILLKKKTVYLDADGVSEEFDWEFIDGDYLTVPATVGNSGQKIRMLFMVLTSDGDLTNRFNIGYDCGWLKADRDGNAIKIIVDKNFGNDSRYTHINFYSADDEWFRRQITVEQYGTEYSVSANIQEPIVFSTFNKQEVSVDIECLGGVRNFKVVSVEKYRVGDESHDVKVDYDNAFVVKNVGGVLSINSYGNPNSIFKETDDGYTLLNPYYYVITIQHVNDNTKELKLKMKFSDECDDTCYHVNPIERLVVEESEDDGMYTPPFVPNLDEEDEEEVVTETPLIEIVTDSGGEYQYDYVGVNDNGAILVNFDNEHLTREVRVNVIPETSKISMGWIGANAVNSYYDNEDIGGDRFVSVTVNEIYTSTKQYYKASFINAVNPSISAEFYIVHNGSNVSHNGL